jgi:hypothetical protein
MEQYTLPAESPSQILVHALDPNKMSKAVYLVEVVLSLLLILGSIGAMAQSRPVHDLNIEKQVSTTPDFHSFSVVSNSDKTFISWLVPQVNKDLSFIIERSANKYDFVAVGFKPGIPSGLEAQYSWIDLCPLSGISFYRLRAVGADGTIVLSTVTSIGADQNQMAGR